MFIIFLVVLFGLVLYLLMAADANVAASNVKMVFSRMVAKVKSWVGL